MIAPNYPLGPDANYKDILDSFRDFLHWYSRDGLVSTKAGVSAPWTHWLNETAGIPPIQISKTPILLDGESGGGIAAIDVLFLNAYKSGGPKLPIQAALLRYPGVKHYTRSFPASGELIYMGKLVKEAETRKHEQALEREQWLLEKHGLAVTCSEGFSPMRMSAAFLLSTTGRWKLMFQREHGPYTAAQLKSMRPLESNIAWPTSHQHEDNWDCIERALNSTNLIDPTKLPNIYIFHGNNDTNCPYEDTEDFQQLLIKNYPTRYNKDTVFLKKVGWLSGAHTKDKKEIKDVGHGFDYTLTEKEEPFLKDIWEKIGGVWPKVVV